MPRPTGLSRLPVCVAAGNSVTVDVGADVLRRGGTAADAAAAMILTSCVAETVFTGIGGGGFAVYVEGGRAVHCLDFFVAVPGLGGTRRLLAQEVPIDFGGEVVPYAVGPSTVAVPGLPAGVQGLHERWGRLPWADVVTPALRHAERGVRLAPMHAKVLSTIAPAMLLGVGADVYGRSGQTLTAGAMIHHPGLDVALTLLRDEGASAFYTGPIAEQMVGAIGSLGDLGEGDLAAYQVNDTTPRAIDLAATRVCARGDDLDDLLGTLERIAMHDDPVQLARSLVTALRRVPSRGDTTSLAVTDKDGNACAVTTSMGLSSGVWLPDYGIHMNSMLGEGELLRRRLVPGERMGSMMSPLVVDGDDGVVLVGGAAGGSRIRSSLVQVLINVVHHGMDVATAIAAPRLNPVPGRVHVEPGFDPAVLAALAADSEVVRWPALDSYFGGVAAIDHSGPGADPRRDGDVRRP
ncbi:MAG: gamma-glutamyltransferase [Propionibacteriales bacterium]|nr:gamma-glutamyltransferase [Propionibacteriales bacterium]